MGDCITVSECFIVKCVGQKENKKRLAVLSMLHFLVISNPGLSQDKRKRIQATGKLSLVCGYPTHSLHL